MLIILSPRVTPVVALVPEVVFCDNTIAIFQVMRSVLPTQYTRKLINTFVIK
jgi:hypothetical protein